MNENILPGKKLLNRKGKEYEKKKKKGVRKQTENKQQNGSSVSSYLSIM